MRNGIGFVRGKRFSAFTISYATTLFQVADISKIYHKKFREIGIYEDFTQKNP